MFLTLLILFEMCLRFCLFRIAFHRLFLKPLNTNINGANIR